MQALLDGTHLEGRCDLLSPVDLKIGKCRLSLVGGIDFDLKNYSRKIRVATKYPHLYQRIFSKGPQLK